MPGLLRVSVVLWIGAVGYAQADDAADAMRYAAEAVELFKSGLDRLESRPADGAAGATGVTELRGQLVNARLVLLRLKDDQAGITQLLRSELGDLEQQKARMERLVSGGYVASDKKDTMESRVLEARLRLAKHTGDTATVSTVLAKQLAVRETNLKRMQMLVEQGIASTSRLSSAREAVLLARLDQAQHDGDQELESSVLQSLLELREQNVTRVHALFSQGIAGQADLAEVKEQVLQLRLRLANHTDDANAAVDAAQALLAAEQQNKKRVSMLADRGVTGPNDLVDAELAVLAAELRVAEHSGDAESKAEVLKKAVSLEQDRLRRIEAMVSRSLVGRLDIAVQKLRIAEMILGQKVIL